MIRKKSVFFFFFLFQLFSKEKKGTGEKKRSFSGGIGQFSSSVYVLHKGFIHERNNCAHAHVTTCPFAK